MSLAMVPPGIRVGQSAFERLQQFIRALEAAALLPDDGEPGPALEDDELMAALVSAHASLATAEAIGDLANAVRDSIYDLRERAEENTAALAGAIEKVGTEIDWLRKEVEAR